MQLSKKQRYVGRLKELDQVRARWVPPWRSILDELFPYGHLFLDRGAARPNQGEVLGEDIINDTPVHALQTLSAGMMAGFTSAALQWFTRAAVDPRLGEMPAVKAYLDEERRALEAAFHASNWYTELANGVYPYLGSIGQGCMLIDQGPSRLVRSEGGLRIVPSIVCESFVPGTYWLDDGPDRRIDTAFLERHLSVRQIVGRFGEGRVSPKVLDDWRQGRWGTVYRVIQAIMPAGKEDGRARSRGAGWVSCWWERTDPRKDVFLHEGFYHEFPVVAPRWSHRPGDTYGRGPGWQVRPAARGLQHKEESVLEMFDRVVDPPMTGPGEIDASMLPGSYTALPETSTRDYKPALDPRSQAAGIDVANASIQRDEVRIGRALYADLWRAVLDDERAGRATATEIQAKRTEVMLMLGPLVHNVDEELLKPAVNRVAAIYARSGALPDPPPELEGQEVSTEFVSILHQVQKATNLGPLRAFVAEVAQLAGLDANVLHKLDTDTIVDEIARITGVRPDVVRPTEEAEKIRQQIAEQAQQQQAGEDALAATEGIRNIGSVDPARLSEAVGALSLVAAGQAGMGVQG